MTAVQDTIAHGDDVLIQNYGRSPVVMKRGAGWHVWDDAGRQYLDLFAGFGGAILGHCHPDLVAAATEQAGKLWHVGNAFYTTPQIEFAERLGQTAFDGRAFFCNSGLEANEAAVKLARLRGLAGGGKKWKTVSLLKSFHGRSLAMMAATGNPAVKAGFGPAVPGFVNVPPTDIAAVKAAVDDETCCIIMEPIQGEGGVNGYPIGFPAAVRKLCDEQDLTLIFDEVWTGAGRTGKWFAYQYFTDAVGNTVEPDIMTLGKALGGGLPVAAMWAKPSLAALLTPGKHGCTLGGNPICMAVARTIFDVIERDGLLDNAAKLGAHARARLMASDVVAAKVSEIRGRGLFIGLELKETPQRFADRALEHGVIVNLTASKVIRLAPPITISAGAWDEGLTKLIALLADL